MKKLLLLMLALMFIIPVSIGLLCHKSPIVLSKTTNHQKITYLETKTNSLTECNLEEYLVGVLAAEMPAEYHIEALKAQAVAARSFIISRLGDKNPEHPDAVVCDDPNHCKAHLNESEAKAKWSVGAADEYWKKLKKATTDTIGEYMICEDEVVEAFFFARSHGKTENSEDVWGASRPYLKSVESKGDMTHPEYESVAEFKYSDARARLRSINLDIITGTTPLKIGKTTYTSGGSIATIEVDGIVFKGKDIRTAFGLKSASFLMTTDADKVRFKVHGYGHGVGMSQYGANYMAANGKKYTEILSHYYTNIQIIKL